MLELDVAVKNIAKHARRATRKQWEKGAVWYNEANLFCQRLATADRHTLEEVAGALAALSPQCTWSNNLLGTIALSRTRTIPASANIYPVNVSKAFSILYEGKKPLDVLGGLKVRAFYCNILNPFYSRAVTIDTHAARAAFGKHDLSTHETTWVFRQPGNRLLQQAYKIVARRYKILPHRLQATVWLRVKADIDATPRDAQEGLYNK